MLRNLIWVLAALIGLTAIDVQTIKAAETQKSDMISLSNVAPELYFQLRRYHKFYGDPNTIDGGLTERSQLLCWQCS